jgi:hypothetical protein
MLRKQTAAIALVLWLMIIAGFMLLVQRFDMEIFFVLALIGILVIVELIQYQYVKPRYMRYLGYIIAAGIVVFASIVVQKVMEILA